MNGTAQMKRQRAKSAKAMWYERVRRRRACNGMMRTARGILTAVNAAMLLEERLHRWCAQYDELIAHIRALSGIPPRLLTSSQ